MDKEDFLTASMKLLQSYIEEDENKASQRLANYDVDSDDIESVLFTIRNWRS